jgi:hypothetical protein
MKKATIIFQLESKKLVTTTGKLILNSMYSDMVKKYL